MERQNAHKYQCTQCPLSFDSKQNLKRHFASLHSLEFQCEICLKTFMTRHYLEVHMKRHNDDRQYTCPNCSKKFVTVSDLNRHVKSHDATSTSKQNEYQFQCELCPLTFDTKEKSNRHFAFVHSNEYPCEICHKNFSTRRYLVVHMKRHNNDRKHTCPICPKTFVTPSDRNRHLKVHETPAVPITCSKCGSKFRNLHRLQIHEATGNCEEQNFACHSCDKWYKTKNGLRVHKQNVHENSERYFCDICKKEFQNKSKLIIHLKKYCQKKIKTAFSQDKLEKPLETSDIPGIQCSMCVEKFDNENHLQMHKEIFHSKDSIFPLKTEADDKQNAHENVEIKTELQDETIPECSLETPSQAKHQCEICQKIFSAVQSLALHMKRHNDDRQFTCPVCPKKFVAAFDRDRHAKTHNASQSDNTYPCTLCSQSFDTKEKLERHFATFHSLEFQCKICQKSFGARRYLRVHMKRHDDDLQYPCPICGTNFITAFVRNRHMKVHENTVNQIKCEHQCSQCALFFETEEKLESHVACYHNLELKCHICQKSFTARHSLEVHIKRHSDNRQFMCPVCPKKFITSSELNRHAKSHDSTTGQSEFNYQCTECPLSFETREKSKRHFALLHSLEFQCEICRKCFAARRYLEVHMKIHNDDRQYGCPICPKKFVTAAVRNAHAKVHDNSAGPITCSKCGSKFRSHRRLRMHEAAINCKERNFACYLCDKWFKTKNGLCIHKQNAHENPERYFCDICKKKFQNKTKLKYHLMTHDQKLSQEKMQSAKSRETSVSSIIQCSTCDEKFEDANHLQMHEEIFHTEHTSLSLKTEADDEQNAHENSECKKEFQNEMKFDAGN